MYNMYRLYTEVKVVEWFICRTEVCTCKSHSNQNLYITDLSHDQSDFFI